MDSATNLVTGSGFNDPSVRTYLNSENARYIIREFMSSAPIKDVDDFKKFMSKSTEEIQAERYTKASYEEAQNMDKLEIDEKSKKKLLKKYPEYERIFDKAFIVRESE